MKKLWFGIAISLLAVTTSSAAQRNRGTDDARSHTSVTGFASAPGEHSPGVFDREQYRFTQQLLFDRLYAERVDTAIDEPIVVEVSAKERAQIDAIDPSQRPVMVGLVKPIGRDVTFADPTGMGKAAALSTGALRPLGDGYVWTLAITAPGATGLRVHLTGMSLTGSAALYIYTPDGGAFGPYTGARDGDFWTNTVLSDVAVLQLRTTGPSAAADLVATSFTVADVGFLGDKFFIGKMASRAKTHCSFNAECIENAECPTASAWGPIDNVQNGVAHMQWISGAFLYMCSGGLIADTDAGSDIPYFLTANHCISRDKDASNLETYWQDMTACGTTDCVDPTSPSTLGASIKATNRTGDYTLMELNEPIPGGLFYLGWNATPVANSDGVPLHRVSHPSGAPQAYSTQDVDTGKPTCRSWPRGSWIYSIDTYGSSRVFDRLWPKLLKAAATEAVSDYEKGKPTPKVTVAAMEELMRSAAAGKRKERDLPGGDVFRVRQGGEHMLLRTIEGKSSKSVHDSFLVVPVFAQSKKAQKLKGIACSKNVLASLCSVMTN